VHTRNLNQSQFKHRDEPPTGQRSLWGSMLLDGWIWIQAGAMEWQQGAFTLSCDPSAFNWICGGWSSASVDIGARESTARVKFPYNIRFDFSLSRARDQMG